MKYIYPSGFKGLFRKVNTIDVCLRPKKRKNSNLIIDHKGKKLYLEYPCKSFKKSFVIKHWDAGNTWL